MIAVRSLSLAFLLLAAGCATEEHPPEAPPAGEAAKAKAKSKAKAPELEMSREELENNDDVGLVPSPRETQKALEAAGIDTELADLIEERKLDVRNKNLDNAAVRTGVVIADMLLTVKTAEKDKLLEQLDQIKLGMKQLNGGSDIDATIVDIRDRVKADAISRDALVKELDELSGAVIPELEFNGNERVVPLIQAGSWLEGANLVAKAVNAANKPAAADSLLKQPAVVEYFIRYVQTEGQDKAPAAVTQKLEEALNTLKKLARKPEPFSTEDVQKVIKTTNDVLALL